MRLKPAHQRVWSVDRQVQFLVYEELGAIPGVRGVRRNSWCTRSWAQFLVYEELGAIKQKNQLVFFFCQGTLPTVCSLLFKARTVLRTSKFDGYFFYVNINLLYFDVCIFMYLTIFMNDVAKYIPNLFDLCLYAT